MVPYIRLLALSTEELLRLVGLSKADFQHLNETLSVYIESQKVISPLSRRGRKDTKLALDGRLTLILYCLRHYPVLICLAAVVGISESYCQKVYSRTARMLANIEKLPQPQGTIGKPRSNLSD